MQEEKVEQSPRAVVFSTTTTPPPPPQPARLPPPPPIPTNPSKKKKKEEEEEEESKCVYQAPCSLIGMFLKKTDRYFFYSRRSPRRRRQSLWNFVGLHGAPWLLTRLCGHRVQAGNLGIFWLWNLRASGKGVAVIMLVMLAAKRLIQND